LTAKAREFLPYFTQTLQADRDIAGRERKTVTAPAQDSNFKAYLTQMRQVMRADEERMVKDQKFFPE
jgi:stress response protein YsnF